MKLVPMERIASQTLLGIRFWDRLMTRPIANSLQVKAQRLSDDLSQRLGRSVVGRATPSGVIAFFGLADTELVEDDPDKQLWQTTPPNHFIAIDVEDKLERYLPMSFVARLPFQGAFKGRGSWLSTPLSRPIPGEQEDMGVSLWSAAPRPTPAGRTAIRAQMVIGDSDSPPPAAHALVEVTVPNDGAPPPIPFHYFGLADANGMLMLPLSYPPVPDPPDGVYPPLDQQAFSLNITVHYSGDIDEQKLPGSHVPNLETILMQPQANIGTHWNNDIPSTLESSATLEQTLTFGRSLILRTAIGELNSAETESVLRILPV